MERDEVMKLAKEAGLLDGPVFAQGLERFAALVAAAERERIAKKIEKLPFGDTSQSFAVWVRQDVP